MIDKGKGKIGGKRPVTDSGRETRSRPSYLPDPVKATLYLVDHGILLECQVNPSTLKRIESADWVSKPSPGSAGHDYQYTGGGERKITATFILDALGASDGDGVLNDLSVFEMMTYPSKGGLNDSMFTGPGTVLFTYGQRTWEVVVTSVSIKEEMHDKKLNPLFVKVQVAMLIDLLYSDANEALHASRKTWSTS
jgi:hypothetical protein